MKRGGVWLGVGGLVLRGDDLLVVKKKYGATTGLWTLPGGFVSPGETLDEAAEREVREETGIRVRTVGVAGIRTGESDNMICFVMEPEPGEPEPDGVEISEARFLPRETLKRDPLSADLLRLILTEEKRLLPAMVRRKFEPRRDYGYQSYKVFSR
ncbi:ADP-ribose pyrophosphatase YjhB (NUDIX family) [Melghirimyces profundicolus]|uniref:ADP-ribose pyrophosphatase YjhB (NUDIX family) n=1 Tax=Melghirimyces profundicolus TaxID=1242148 RepID=A0A2T6BSU7_9BACL|nr:NUDIX domain-containing protein [Melghirimyces profundicolus]PTX59142.1 ADP-ribose pyrophosphatase YjhB (NUDIX family) [Melghirimyces profundicolus]